MILLSISWNDNNAETSADIHPYDVILTICSDVPPLVAFGATHIASFATFDSVSIAQLTSIGNTSLSIICWI